MTGFAYDRGPKTKLWVRTGLALFGAATLAVPLASAWAEGDEPAQPAATGAAETGATTAGASATGAPSAELTAEQIAHARQVFNDASCNACHTLADANAVGQIGPVLDGNAALDHELIALRVTHGQGMMPGFGGQISDEDIDLLATYIMQVKQ